MSEIEEIRKSLSPSINASKVPLSYVERLLPKFKGTSCIVLHKTVCTKHSPKIITNEPKIEYIEEDETSKFDVTGSPLKYSFGEDNFDDTVVLVKRHWLKEEEQYLPLDIIAACNALNACLETTVKSSLPIIALCDSKDKRKTRLLGTTINGEWFTTIDAYATGIETLNEIKDSHLVLLQEHMKLSSVQEHDITVSAFNTIDLFGTKENMIDWNENLKCTFEGSLCVEVESCSLSLHPPTRASKNDLVIQIVTGSDSSALKELWKQLLLLNQYLAILETYKADVNAQYNSFLLKFPDDFNTPYVEKCDRILENIKFLLNGDYNYRNLEGDDLHKTDIINEESVENDVKIEEYIQSLSRRHNIDFTDHLWDLLIRNSNCFDIKKCFHVVLEEIVSGGCLTQVNLTNATRFAKIIGNPHPQKVISHLLPGSLPLEYLIDMGFEKLGRDYTYILINTKLGDIHDIQRKFGSVSTGEFKIDAYRKKLMCMAQIHVCLEFMLLVQNNLECPTESLRTLFSSAFKQFVCDDSPIRNHNELSRNTIYSLKAPVPVSMINELNKEVPSTRRISLSSQSRVSKLTTTKYYSRLPIFPTNIFHPDESDTMDVAYHVTSVVCSSNKYK